LFKSFSKHYPEVSFHHSYPGFVNTKLARNLPWYFKYPGFLLGNLGMSIENCGDYSLYGIASHLKEKTGFWSLIKQDGETIEPTKFQTNEACEKSWDWFMEFLNKREASQIN
jgi:phosphoglucomutase